MTIHRMPQGSEAWLKIRAAVPTASEFDRLITPLGKAKKGDAFDSYLAEKLAERWTHAPLPSFAAFGAVEQGKLREEVAIPWFCGMREIAVEAVGFITTDDGRVGCSPDAMLTGDIRGLECKCPNAETHMGWLVDDHLPEKHVAQIQGSMLVTGAPSWWFMSYHPQLPSLIIEVARNDAFIETLAGQLKLFNEHLDVKYAALVDRYGQPNRKKGCE